MRNVIPIIMYEDEKLAILIAGRVKILFVVPAELPVIEESIGVTICGAIGIEPGRQHSRYG